MIMLNIHDHVSLLLQCSSQGVKDNEELRKSHEEIQPRVVEVMQKVSSSKTIYSAFKMLLDDSVCATGDGIQYTEAEKRVIESAVKDAELSGVGLEGEKKTRFVEIQSALSKVERRHAEACIGNTSFRV